MTRAASLRTRLILIILLPLLLISAGIGVWAFQNAELRAKERFDLSLLSTTLAISRDVALSGGDALSPATRDLIKDTSGGPVFYHVYAPDGVFVTGYATPPVPPDAVRGVAKAQTYFDANYRGKPVRVLRLRDATQIDGVSGDFTFTVWQDTDVRDAFVSETAQQTYTIIAILIASVGLIVWFGVGYGLRPLLSLQDAISKRTTDDLAPIKRAVPVETEGIVKTLNTLLSQVSTTMTAKDDFISSAAHQLRNPIAGVRAMAEAVRSAPNAQAAKERITDLLSAAEHASDLANQLLSFERANAPLDRGNFQTFDLSALLNETVQAVRLRKPASNILFDPSKAVKAVHVEGDALMVGEAISNLIDNAVLHGGAELTQVLVGLSVDGGMVEVRVTDDGVGIDPKQITTALERFGQVNPAQGSGLGLPIARAVAEQHKGSLKIHPQEKGLSVALTLPLRQQ